MKRIFLSLDDYRLISVIIIIIIIIISLYSFIKTLKQKKLDKKINNKVHTAINKSKIIERQNLDKLKKFWSAEPQTKSPEFLKIVLDFENKYFYRVVVSSNDEGLG